MQLAVRDYAARSSSARRAKASSAKIAIDPLEDHTHQCATFGLLLIVLGCRGAEDAPRLVAAWIGVAYSFTASTSFTNPAITIARSLSDTFAGIRPHHVRIHNLAAHRRVGGLLRWTLAVLIAR